MPEVNDFLRMTIISELEGVAMRNDIYVQLINLGDQTTLTGMVAIFGQEYIDVSNDLLTTELHYVAFILDNLTRNEVRGLLTSTAQGLLIEGSHPQDQVVRINEWGSNQGEPELRRGAFNLSGIGKSLSEDGRINDIQKFNPLEVYLSTQFLDSTSGLTMNPQVRRRVPGSSPPIYTFHRIEQALANPTYFKLKSRKTNVLGI